MSEAADEWIDEDETYCKLRRLKPYHRATTSGGAVMPKLGIFRETNTVTFANEAVRELMRRSTRQTAHTDELLISTRETDDMPMGEHGLTPAYCPTVQGG